MKTIEQIITMIDTENINDQSKLLAYKVLAYMIERGEQRKDKVERELIEVSKSQPKDDVKQEQTITDREYLQGLEPSKKTVRNLSQEELEKLRKIEQKMKEGM
jgi:hypothetical protein